MLQIVSFVLAGIVLYFWAVRPLLQHSPSFVWLFSREHGFFTSLRVKLAGLKTLLLARASMVLTGFVAVHDLVARNEVGIDWTPLTSQLPSWSWPLILFADFYLIMKFRQFTDTRAEKADV